MGISLENVVGIINLFLDDCKITLEQADEELVNFGVDSLSFIRLIVSLEEELDIEIPDIYLDYSQMNTLTKITDILNLIKK